VYARVSTAEEVNVDEMDEGIRIFDEEIVPTLKKAPGAVEGLLLVDREAAKAVIVGIYESKEDMKAFMESGKYQEQVAKFLTKVITKMPVTEEYEVASRFLFKTD